MVHVFALLGVTLLIMLPIGLGISISMPIRVQDRMKMFFVAPFAFLVGTVLISFGCDDCPESLVSFSGYGQAASTLGCLGVVLGLVAQTRKARDLD